MDAAHTPSDRVRRVNQEIAAAERVLHEHLQFVLAALRKGMDTTAAETRVRDMRIALQTLHAQRRQAIREAEFEGMPPLRTTG